MSWFQIYKYIYNSQTTEYDIAQVKVPLRRLINISNLKKDIEAGEQIYANLQNRSINSYINPGLETATDDYSYIVVHQDEADENYFFPVKSKVDGNVLHFEAVESIQKNIFETRYYAVYYGSSYIKYITPENNEDQLIYVKPEVFVTSYYNIDSIENYTYTADLNSELYSLAYYNSGIDWIDGVSKKIEAKAFGVFDGPKFKLIGSKGKSYGKFKIRIFAYSNEETISSNASVDWVEVDCYADDELSDQTLYQIETLEYNKYIFEIETLGNKNPLSASNDVKIDKYMFSPDYGLFCDKEEINPSLSFITIAGVR